MKHKAPLLRSSLTAAPHVMAHYVTVNTLHVILLLADVKRMLN